MTLWFEKVTYTGTHFLCAMGLWSSSGIRKETKGSLSLQCIIVYIAIPAGELRAHCAVIREMFLILNMDLGVMVVKLPASPETVVICDMTQKE